MTCEDYERNGPGIVEKAALQLAPLLASRPIRALARLLPQDPLGVPVEPSFSDADHRRVKMMRLVEQEEIEPFGKTHLPEGRV